MKTKNRKEHQVSFIYILIFLAIEVCIVIAGYQYYKNFEQNFRTHVENQLRLIADLKVIEVDHWIVDHRADAETVFGNKVFTQYIKSYFKDPKDVNAEREIRVWMKEFQTGFNFDVVKLIDPQLVKKIIIPEAVEQTLAYFSPGNIDSLKANKLVFVDFYYNELKQKIFLKVLIPIIDEHKLIAIVELRIDPQPRFYPILTNWPVPNETSETFILRREGNEAIYLNELKFQKNAALNLRVPLDNKNVLSVKSVSGYEGIIEGIGYRGKGVIAYVKKVPHSPWFLVAQIEDSEAYAPLKDKRRETMIFFFGIFLVVGMGFVFVWRNQRTLFLKEKIKSAEALRESEERFRMMFDKAPLSFQSLDIIGNIVDVNQTWLETFGYDREEVLGKWFGNFIAPKDVDSFKERFPIFKEKGKLRGEFEMMHKNGTSMFIYFDGRVANDTHGNFLQTHGILKDITLFKKAESEQQVLYEIAHSIVTTSNLAESLKLIHQSLGKVLYADNFFVALYDQNTELFSFPYFADQFNQTPEPVAMRKSLTSYVFRTGIPLLITPEIFSRLKEQNEVELVGSPSPSWIGIPLHTPARTIGILVLQHYEKENVYSERDIEFLNTVGSQIALIIERKLAEEDLRNERLLLRTVIDNIPDSIYCKDLDCRKTLVNLAELRYLKVKSYTEILGKDDFDLYPRELAEKFFADDQTVLQTGNPVLNREEYLFDENGDKLWLLTSKLPLRDSNGQIIGLVGIGHNITDRKDADEEIRSKNEELLKANSEKDKFFSIIAHDLRSPFNGFLGLTQIMAEELSDLTMDEIQKISVSMRNSAANLFRLLENLLEWARMQQGLIPFNPKAVELLPIVDECISMMLEPAKNKGIEIAYDIPEDLVVFADSNILQTVIRNLVSNALKFTPNGGKVSLSAKDTGNKSVEISISDTGIGMSQKMIDNLFRLDIQTNRKGTEGEPSTGLGLLLCKEFVEKHGGEIWVESEEGKGSVFYFTIPSKI